MKRTLLLIVSFILLLSLASCGKGRIVHCDGCGKEIEVPAGSNMTEDWIVLCEECKAKVGE